MGWLDKLRARKDALVGAGAAPESAPAARKAHDAQEPVRALLREALVLREAGRADEALAAGQRALALAPGANDWRLLAVLHAEAGFAEAAYEFSRRAATADPHNLQARSRELFFSNFSESIARAGQFSRHREYGALLEQQVAPVWRGKWTGSRDAGRRLRIGFVSADLFHHPVGMFLLPLLEHLDRSAWEPWCYASVEKPDAATEAIRAHSAQFIDARALSDTELAARIHADGIDVLVDLGGHSSAPRLAVFAEQPAPVQLTWLGYLNTTGMTRIGWRICDARTDPLDTQAWNTEALLAIEGSQWCYRPFVDELPGDTAPCVSNGFVTFGSFNNARKITDAMCERWARLMTQCSGSRLLLADVATQTKRAAVLRVFEREGIAADRLSFAPRADLRAYYRLFERVDIALDTYPYGGGTTTLDALWMGVPVLTLAGELPVSRSAASILELLGLEDWIADSPEALAALGVARAADVPALVHLRRELRGMLQASPLMDERAFARNFERAVREQWVRLTRNDSALALQAAEAMHAAGDDAGALAALDRILDTNPHHAAALRGRGLVLLKLGRPNEALAAFEGALAVAGPTPDGLTSKAGALQKLGRSDDALAAVRSALEMNDRHAGALCAGVGILIEQMRLRDALEMGRHALQLHPQDADLHWNTGVAHLLLGELKEGFAEHEWRWRSGLMRRIAGPSIHAPRWAGEDLRGKTILLYAEQGFGDTVQCARFVAPLATLAKSVYLDVPAPLQALMSGIAPNVTLLRGGDQVPALDFQAALMSLPHALGVSMDTLPGKVPYLTADPQRVAQWRRRLNDESGRMKAGLVWSGNPAHANDRNRSIPLGVMRAVEAQGWRFASLQPEVRESDAAAARDWPGLVQAGADLRDFADTAALLEALDLVITVDTSVAHLAGALGRPVWILLPFCPDWRWMAGREDSPWYPSARLFRQPAPGDWRSVLDRVRAALESAAGVRPPAADVDWKAQGNAALGEWRLDEAERCYRLAVASAPDDAASQLNLGFVLVEAGRPGEALAHLQQAIALGGFAHDAHFLRGRAQALLGRADEGLASFEAAVTEKPDFIEAMEEAARVAQAAGRTDAALAWAERMRAARQKSSRS